MTHIGNVNEVKRLLTHQKVVNQIDRLDEHFMAPLHIAAKFEQDEIVKILVEKGAGRLNLVICKTSLPLFNFLESSFCTAINLN